MRNLIALLALSGVVLAGCSGGDSASGSAADQAAAESYKSKDRVPPPPGSDQPDAGTGTGSSGIRVVPPNAPGDRS